MSTTITETDLHKDALSLSETTCAIIWSTIVEPGDMAARRWIGNHGGYAKGLAALYEVNENPITELLEPLGWRSKLSVRRINDVFRLMAGHQIIAITPEHEAWPDRLGDLGNPPLVLFTQGNLDLLTDGGIALVGARAATNYGEHVTMMLAQGIVDRDVAVISGAAYGIDAMAHRATIAGRGKTIAVLAGGLDRYYPHGHADLISRVRETGLVVSEVPPGTETTRWRFLQRNRLIAALSWATVVVEAGARSGSMNTAMHALTIKRPLGAVPGPVTSPASMGTNRLLGRDHGASPIIEVQDIFDMLDRRFEEELGDLAPEAEAHTVAGTERLAHSLAAHTGADLSEAEMLDNYLADAEEIGRSHPHLLTLTERGLA